MRSRCRSVPVPAVKSPSFSPRTRCALNGTSGRCPCRYAPAFGDTSRRSRLARIRLICVGSALPQPEQCSRSRRGLPALRWRRLGRRSARYRTRESDVACSGHEPPRPVPPGWVTVLDSGNGGRENSDVAARCPAAPGAIAAAAVVRAGSSCRRARSAATRRLRSLGWARPPPVSPGAGSGRWLVRSGCTGRVRPTCRYRWSPPGTRRSRTSEWGQR